MPGLSSHVLNAIAKVAVDGGHGTGFLVADGLLLTAMHVVGDRRQQKIHPGPFTVTFATAQATARVHGDYWDPVADWALLECDGLPAGVTPLPLGRLDRSDGIWDTFGFPIANPDGMVQRGTVRNQHATLQGAPAYQLFSEEAAAGNGAPAPGLSGAPVIVDGHVVGLLRYALMDSQKQTVGGTLYACPASSLVGRCGTFLTVVELQTDPFSALKAGCCAVVGGGTAYLIDPQRLATSARVVEGRDPLAVRFEGREYPATVERVDTGSDTAILVLATPLAGAQPLPLAECGRGMVTWHGYGFVGGDSIPLTGTVMDASAMTLSSEIPLAGPAFDELLGTPVLVDATVVGHLTRAKPFGLIAAAPSRCVRALQASAVALPAVDPPPVAVSEAIRAAIAAGPQRLAALWEEWQSSGMPTGAAGLPVARAFLDFSRPEQALVVLDAGGTGLRESQLRALALSRLGRDDEAIEMLEKLAQAGQLDAETGGLLAGRYKRMWQKSGQRSYLQKSYDVYREAFAQSGDAYPGINAAALALQLGDHEQASAIAGQVVTELKKVAIEEMDLWGLATQGEGHLLANQLTEARDWYSRAVASAPKAYAAIAVMRRQARMNLKALGHAESALDDILCIPGIVVFTGHMVDLPNRPTPRFPASMIGTVREGIGERLRRLDAGLGFSSAARGGDILFLEGLLERGGSAEVVLPFSKQDFQQTSVGDQWSERYARVLEHPRINVTVLAEALPPEDARPEAYLECTRQLYRRAIALASSLDEKPTLLIVWNGEAGDGPGGTADAVSEWEQQGHAVERIDIPTPSPPTQPDSA